MKRQRWTVGAAVIGAISMTVRMTQACSTDAGKATTEPSPADEAAPAAGEELSPDDAAAFAERAARQLTAEHPEVGELMIGQVGPVYDENLPGPIAVSVQLRLRSARDVTMELLATRVDDMGRHVGEPRTAKITNLRGLTVQVSLATGDLINVTPMAFVEDAGRPNDITQVEYLDP